MYNNDYIVDEIHKQIYEKKKKNRKLFIVKVIFLFDD